MSIELHLRSPGAAPYEYFLSVMYSDGSSSECELMPRANRAGFKLNEGAKAHIWLLPRTIVVGVGVFDVNSAR